MNEHKTKNTTKGICITSFCLLIATLIFQMYIANSTALKGKDFQEQHTYKKLLEKEVALLKYQDANLSCLTNIESRAYEIGYVKMTGSIIPITPPSLASLTIQ